MVSEREWNLQMEEGLSQVEEQKEEKNLRFQTKENIKNSFFQILAIVIFLPYHHKIATSEFLVQSFKTE